MNLKEVLIILLFLVTNKVFASPQSPDLLIYNGDTIGIYTLLLEEYFDQIKKTDDVEGKLFGLNFREGASLNCWRGYQAIFIIEENSLWLEQITSCNEYYYSDSIDVKESKRRISEIFGDKVVNRKVLVDWFTGELSISKPDRKLLRWDGVFVRTFEEEILIQFERGEVKNITEIENYIDEPTRTNRRYGDTLSNVVFKEIQKIKWKDIDKFDCSEVYLIIVGKNGLIKEVIMPEYQTEEQIKEYWDTKREYNYCIRTLTKGLKNLKFDIVKNLGKPIEEDIYIEIWFNDDGTIENWTD